MRRKEKLARALLKEINIIIHDALKDPRLGLVSITHIEISPDLRQAKVFFSVLGKDQDYRITHEILNSAKGFIRHMISQRMRLKYTPEIIFREDRSAEESIRIQEIINEINKENEHL
ncbi:MAG: 30S ribosome-binding factor RbfA [Candidatus Omnitrophica bacterium]|nr:30S ribosome-binding factor RbfA [Candidatus Omnitrophota bacterium]